MFQERIDGQNNRSSRPKVFCKKGALGNFTKFAGKHLCQSFFFNKVTGLRPATLRKKRLWHKCFICEFCEILKNTYYFRTPLMAASEISYENIDRVLWCFFISLENVSKTNFLI